MAEALEIAGLGNAIDRRVRTYSQGMRQRLAIAQAMLGLPDLLLMDEPTNGLDPPQIHAMREVLRRYAATGRTVLVSSHLLSEVEQTCSHVVVVHLGRTIASGTVAELVVLVRRDGASTVDDRQAAAAGAADHGRVTSRSPRPACRPTWAACPAAGGGGAGRGRRRGQLGRTTQPAGGRVPRADRRLRFRSHRGGRGPRCRQPAVPTAATPTQVDRPTVRRPAARRQPRTITARQSDPAHSREVRNEPRPPGPFGGRRRRRDERGHRLGAGRPTPAPRRDSGSAGRCRSGWS